jgi:hypothetical protein
VSATSPGRPIARLALELRLTGSGLVALGIACLIVAAASGDIGLARLAVPFLVAFAAVGGFSLYNSRWMRSAARPDAAPGARVEAPRLTMRRVLVSLVLPLIAVGVAAALGPGLAVVMGGVVAGVGAVDIRNFRWVRERERHEGDVLFRELGGSPFAGGKRPLYTRPM